MLTFRDINSLNSDKEGQAALEALRSARVPNHTAAYRIGKSLRGLEQAQREFQEKRDSLIEEFGTTLDEQGNEVAPYISVKDSARLKAFTDELNAFLRVEPVDLRIYPVKLDDLGEAELPAGVFEFLWFLFEEPEA